MVGPTQDFSRVEGPKAASCAAGHDFAARDRLYVGTTWKDVAIHLLQMWPFLPLPS